MGTVVVTGVINGGWPKPEVTLTLFVDGVPSGTYMIPSSQLIIGQPFSQSWVVSDGHMAYVNIHAPNGIGSFDANSNQICINCPTTTIIGDGGKNLYGNIPGKG